MSAPKPMSVPCPYSLEWTERVCESSAAICGTHQPPIDFMPIYLRRITYLEMYQPNLPPISLADLQQDIQERDRSSAPITWIQKREGHESRDYVLLKQVSGIPPAVHERLGIMQALVSVLITRSCSYHCCRCAVILVLFYHCLSIVYATPKKLGGIINICLTNQVTL